MMAHFVAVPGTSKWFDPSAQITSFDYTLEDFTKSEQHYDLIFHLMANRSFANAAGDSGRHGWVVP